MLPRCPRREGIAGQGQTSPSGLWSHAVTTPPSRNLEARSPACQFESLDAKASAVLGWPARLPHLPGVSDRRSASCHPGSHRGSSDSGRGLLAEKAPRPRRPVSGCRGLMHTSLPFTCGTSAHAAGRARTLLFEQGDRNRYPITSTAIDLTATRLTRPAAVSSRMASVRARRATGSGNPKRSMSTGYSASRLTSGRLGPRSRSRTRTRTRLLRAHLSGQQSTPPPRA